MSKYNLFSRLLPQIWHMYKYVLKHPFRQDACHEKSNMDQQLPNRWTFVVAVTDDDQKTRIECPFRILNYKSS